MAEQRIGHMFARAPASTADGAWPHEAVRRAIEKLASDALERGVAVARVNMRGVYSKSIGEGGAQERELAAESLRWAEAMPTTPRTAAMLRRISENWMRYAERADVEANEDALRW
jgi:alpha/beta superfamily hydrolase